jgi:hypothetical protein
MTPYSETWTPYSSLDAMDVLDIMDVLYYPTLLSTTCG